MIGNLVRGRLRRILAFLGVPLAAAGAVVVLTATPAHAALIYQGTFTLQAGGGCAQVENNGVTNRTPIQLASCNGSAAQRWAVYLTLDQGNLWILAYGGAQPLNKCMDKGGAVHMWIYGCHGGSQQRWIHNSLQQIVSVNEQSRCVNIGTSSSNSTLGLTSCIVADSTARAPAWQFVPA